MNPLDWSGPDFLAAYVPLLIITYVTARIFQAVLRLPGGTPERFELDLDAYQAAALQGPDEVTRTTVAALIQDKRLRIDDGLLFANDGSLPPRARPVERAVYDSVSGGSSEHSELLAAVTEKMDTLEEPLRRKGFLLTPEQEGQARWLPVLLYTAALGLGVAKLCIGLSRGRPVAFLLVLLLVAVVVGYATLLSASTQKRTRRGDAALELLREQHQPLKVTASAEGAELNTGHVAMAVALFGVGSLASNGFGDLRNLLAPPRPQFSGDSSSVDLGDSSGGSSCSSSSSSCSGGSSCGGGGGCGGCGGGGD
jgi:uncharacterized protein (TIGR04222 family)